MSLAYLSPRSYFIYLTFITSSVHSSDIYWTPIKCQAMWPGAWNTEVNKVSDFQQRASNDHTNWLYLAYYIIIVVLRWKSIKKTGGEELAEYLFLGESITLRMSGLVVFDPGYRQESSGHLSFFFFFWLPCGIWSSKAWDQIWARAVM